MYNTYSSRIPDYPSARIVLILALIPTFLWVVILTHEFEILLATNIPRADLLWKLAQHPPLAHNEITSFFANALWKTGAKWSSSGISPKLAFAISQ